MEEVFSNQSVDTEARSASSVRRPLGLSKIRYLTNRPLKGRRLSVETVTCANVWPRSLAQHFWHLCREQSGFWIAKLHGAGVELQASASQKKALLFSSLISREGGLRAIAGL